MVLTEKDKKLLYALCIVLILAVFGLFVIKPQIEKRGKLTEQLEELEVKEGAMQIAIAGAPASDQIIKESKKEFDEITKDFYPLMISNQIEPVITEMVLKHGLTSVQLEVSSKPEIKDIEAYFASEAAQQVALDAMMKEAEGKEDTGTAEQDIATQDVENEPAQTGGETQAAIAQDIVYTSQIAVTVSGSRESMEALIDEISNDRPAIRVTGFTMDTQTGINAENQVQSVSSMTIKMELYMCNKEN